MDPGAAPFLAGLLRHAALFVEFSLDRGDFVMPVEKNTIGFAEHVLKATRQGGQHASE